MRPSDRGKSKAQRIRLDYYRGAGWFDRLRYLTICIGSLLASLYGGWICWSLSSDSLDMRRIHLSTGPVAQVHAAFENNCEKCHGAGLEVSLGQDSWTTDAARRLDHQEEACQKCHHIQDHFRSQLVEPAQDRDCSSCHREHKGRQNQLAEIANQKCVACHADLQKACKGDVEPSLENTLRVKYFNSGTHGHSTDKCREPQFRSLMQDTGRVKFDHAQHLQPGQIDPGTRGGMRLGMLSASQQALYRQPGQSDTDFVQLNCASCHQLHTVNRRNHHVSADAEGRYYTPINFDKHCVACHQLTFAGQTGDMLPLPHLATRAEYEVLLMAKRQGMQAQSRASNSRQETSPISKQLTSYDRIEAASLQQSLALAEASITAASTIVALDALMERCHQCHQPGDTTEQAITLAMAGKLEPLIPSRWLMNGYFDHAAHQRIENCQFCHAIPGSVAGEAYVAGPPIDQQRVDIRGPESCDICHRPAEQKEPTQLMSTASVKQLFGRADQPTWASDNCIECHRYHWNHSSSHAPMPAAVQP